jgi:catechol 2,3-dioxygenase-like lactoylglutathione lyase family enzyme
LERPFEITELDHVVLRCRDQARALEFYTEVLGLHEERRIDAIGLIQLRAGRSMIDLVPMHEARDESRRNVDHLCLAIVASDLDAVARHLAARGVTVIGEPSMRYGAQGMGLSIYINDSEGNVVELKQIAAADASGR